MKHSFSKRLTAWLLTVVMAVTMLPAMAAAAESEAASPLPAAETEAEIPTAPETPAPSEAPEAPEDDGDTEGVYSNGEDAQPQGLMRTPMLTAEADDKRAYYQIIMEDGTAIKLYPGVTGGHCIRTNESTEAEPGGETPDDYVVRLVGKPAGSTTYYYTLYLKNFKGQSITYCDGETGGPYNRDFLYIEVEGDNYLTAGTASLRDGVYTAIGRTILKGNQDITYRISNNHPARGLLTIKAVNGDVSGMKKAYGIACQNLNLSGSAIQSGSFVLNITLSGNKTGDDRAITVTNRLIVESYASMILNVQGLNAVYNESKFYGNHTTNPPNDESKFTYFLINTEGNVNVTLDAMGLSGRACAFYNGYYQDHNFAAWTDGVNELRKVGKMTVTVRNLNSDQLADVRANPGGISWVGAKPGWKTEWGKGLLLDELQADGTCIFEYAPGVTPSQIAKVIIYDGEIGNGHYIARAGKEYPPGIGTTIYAPITAPKMWDNIPFKCWTTVDGAPLTFTSADGATNGDLAVLLLEPKSTTKLLAMYDPFTSQPKWEPVYNKTYNCYDGKIAWTAAYGMQVAAGRLVPENYTLNDSLEPVAVTDPKGRDVLEVWSGVSRFSIEDENCNYSVPEGRYRIALKNGRDGRWHYSEPFNISYALAEPRISPDGGFPDGDKVDVTISSAADAEIWYRVYDDTTQTMPDVQSYTGWFEIPVTSDRGTVVVEAYATKDGKQSAWATAKFSTKPAAPTVKLPDGTTAKSGTTYIYYDAADISAVVPDGVEVRYGAAPPSNGAPGTKLGKGETFTVSNGNGHLQTTYLCARKTIRSGNRTYTAWSEPFSLVLARVGDLPQATLKVNGRDMQSGATYTVDGSAEVTLTRPEYCPVDAQIVYSDNSAVPSYCTKYTGPITISHRATTLDVYTRAWNSEKNAYDASPRDVYHFQIKQGTTPWKLNLTNAKAYDSTGTQITTAYSGTVVTVRADPSPGGTGAFHYWIGLSSYLENPEVEKYLPEVTFVMPERIVTAKPSYTSSTAINYTKVIVDMDATAGGSSLYLDDPALRSISYSWWEGDTVGAEADKLLSYVTFDPNKTYTARVTVTANDGATFDSDATVSTASRKKVSRAFTVPEHELTRDGNTSVTFEIHPAARLALTMPALHPGDQMLSAADFGGLPYGMNVRAITWASTPPAYAGAVGTEYTISEMVLELDGTCPPVFIGCTLNGVSYSCSYSKENDAIILKDIKVPVVSQGVSVSGTAVSWNDTDNAVYLLYDGSAGDTDIKAEWKAGVYTTALAYTPVKGGMIANADGKRHDQTFTFQAIPAGDYKLVILKPGKYVPKIVPITVSEADCDCGQLKLWLYGDVNYDGKVNAADSTQVLRYFNAKSPNVFSQGSAQDQADRLLAANVNGDSIINAADSTQIIRYFNNKLPNVLANLT